MGFNSKEYKETSGGGPATLTPGTQEIKVISIEIKDSTYKPEEGGKDVTFFVQGRPIEGFKGFLINKDDESKGYYNCQIGWIKANGGFSFKDFATSDDVIPTDQLIFNYIMKMIKEIGLLDEANAGEGMKAASIEEFIKKAEVIIAKKWFKATIGGTESINGKYTNYFLNFPYGKGKIPFTQIDAPASNFIEYNKDVHIYRKNAPKPVSEFSSGTSEKKPWETDTPPSENGMSKAKEPWNTEAEPAKGDNVPTVYDDLPF